MNAVICLRFFPIMSRETKFQRLRSLLFASQTKVRDSFSSLQAGREMILQENSFISAAEPLMRFNQLGRNVVAVFQPAAFLELQFAPARTRLIAARKRFIVFAWRDFQDCSHF